VWEQRIAGSRAGVLATGGNLVFQSTGTEFKAYRGDTGEEMWSSEIQSGAVGGPVSYEIASG
jgi:quinohemoprotein ethanol dehydrogenase